MAREQRSPEEREFIRKGSRREAAKRYARIKAREIQWQTPSRGIEDIAAELYRGYVADLDRRGL